MEVLSKNDEEEIYQIYKITYRDTVNKKQNNIADFYVWLVDHHCVHVQTFVNKLSKLYVEETDPFNEYNNLYVLDIGAYLYNNNYINTYPIFDKTSKITGKKDIGKKLPKNNYRLKKRIRPEQIEMK